MTLILQLICVVAALFMGYWGGNYISVATTSHSAIHELAGMLGLSMAVLLFAAAGILGAIAANRRRIVALEAYVQETAGPSRVVRMAKQTQGDPIIALLALAQAGQPVEKQAKVRDDYLAAALGRTRLNTNDRDELTAWQSTLPVDSDAISGAFSRLSSADRDTADLLLKAARDTVKVAGKPSDQQSKLLDHLGRLLA